MTFSTRSAHGPGTAYSTFGSVGSNAIAHEMHWLSCRQGSIRQLRPASVLRYTPDMSDAQNISFGSCGLETGTKIPPPPPMP
ncbi:MAG: hypothetical protein ACYS5V_17860 [Planctomycetota bacterium]